MWLDRYRCAATISVDFDAETLWTGTFHLPTPSPMSRGDYDVRAALPRIHELFDRHQIPATFMIPAQVVDEHPDACAEIAERGRHEVGYHGYHHESVLELPIERERELMARGIARLEETFGHRPAGNRSPPFALGPNTADLLEEFGFAYDSSLFGHDEPYRPQVPITGGPLRDFVELPVSWELDDAPYFLFSFFPYMSGLCTPAQVLEIWKAEFDGSYRVGGCFLLVVHPFCIGRHPRIAMLDELISYIRGFDDVWFATHLQVAEEWRRRQVAQGAWGPQVHASAG
ncbi:MAG: polysaccharide deacetylase [Solirubrobacterales bacterium]|nr:polysaccharide deacetylase [Solirubrobacterales bacterium]